VKLPRPVRAGRARSAGFGPWVIQYYAYDFSDIVDSDVDGAVGARAAAALFDRFAGPWEVRVLRRNTAALAFWRKVIDRYTGGAYTELEWATSDSAESCNGSMSCPEGLNLAAATIRRCRN
jgi:hypothetical protein